MNHASRLALSEALRRRLTPNTVLSRQQVAYAIGVSTDTVDNVLAAASGTRWQVAYELIQFFWSQGDRGFMFEITGIEPLPIVSRHEIAAARRTLVALETALGAA